jgi:hypothetical protein
MSLTEAVKPLVKSTNATYLKQLLEFNNYSIAETVGECYKIHGFDNYNQLLTINSMFSSYPRFAPVDRTQQALGPICYSPERPWTVPLKELTLEDALCQRVTELCLADQKLNLLWSGGIDSTAIVVSFLRYAPDLTQCRIIYSPWSTFEHPDFFKLLKTFDNLELVDMSGEMYLDFAIDGLIITGHASDEIHASLDESFFIQHGYDFLSTPWKDFFYSKLPDDKFIEFCERHFAAAGRDITTVLDARWWFYTSSKLTSLLNNSNLVFFTADNALFDPGRLIGFFDCNAYEQFIYFNTDKIIQSDNYSTWRQFLKNFCYDFDGLNDWRVNKSKFSSNQIQIYTYKKQILNNARNLMILDNGERVCTPSLPLFSSNEWNQIKSNYQHVFRPPDSV